MRKSLQDLEGKRDATGFLGLRKPGVSVQGILRPRVQMEPKHSRPKKGKSPCSSQRGGGESAWARGKVGGERKGVLMRDFTKRGKKFVIP